jgi:DHA1 family inner membrane transport protein
MSTPQAAVSQKRANLTLATLFSGVFVLGCAELLVIGVLNVLAADLNVSIPTAGTLVTAYALGIAIGGPILTALTIKLNRRTILVGAIVVFALANLIVVLIPNYGLFFAARVVAGAVQGLFIAGGFMVGMAIVPPERAGRAISTVISGVAVSAAVGVPLGTLVGQTLGWRGSFTAIVVLAGLALIAILALVPSVPSAGGAAGQTKYAFAPRVLAVLGLCFVAFASLFSVLTYIVPFLESVTGVTGATVSVFLLVYGVATAVGSFGGGRFADKNAARTLIVATTGTAVALLALYFVGSVAALAAVAILVWGLFAFGMAASLQLRVVVLAGPGGALAQSLPASAINVGIAVGPVVGGLALSNFSASATVITGLVIAVIGIVVAWATSFLKPPVVPAEAGPVASSGPTADVA